MRQHIQKSITRLFFDRRQVQATIQPASMSSKQPLSYSAALRNKGSDSQDEGQKQQQGHDGSERGEVKPNYERAATWSNHTGRVVRYHGGTGPGPRKQPEPRAAHEEASANAPTSQQPGLPKGPYTKETYQIDPAHVPSTGVAEDKTYILTLQTSPEIHNAANTLRQRHFPIRLNKLSAHITLFQALPGSKIHDITSDLRRVAVHQKPFDISIGAPKRLRAGVALSIQGLEPAKLIHAELRDSWKSFLSQQDMGGFQGHYTIQNKVEDQEEVDSTFQEVSTTFEGASGTGTALTLFEYDKGYWRYLRPFPFRSLEK